MDGTLKKIGKGYKLFDKLGNCFNSSLLSLKKCDDIFSTATDIEKYTNEIIVEISRVNKLNLETGRFEWTFRFDNDGCIIFNKK